MKKLLSILFISLFATGTAYSAVLTEDFSGAFPEWESNWLGTNSNLENYYGVGQDRGNNPDGLWLDDGDGIRGTDTVEILFDTTFGASLTSLSLDLGAHVGGLSISIFDMAGIAIFSSAVPTGSALSNPGFYANFSVSSTNGISGFSLFSSGNQIEGNTGLDNVVVNTGKVSVPEASSILLLGLGLAGLGFTRRNKKA